MSIDVDALLRELHLHKRRTIISQLLAGNDMRCFTTEQYTARMFDKTMESGPKPEYKGVGPYLPLGRKQLLEERGLQEVAPDIWGQRENTPREALVAKEGKK